MCKTPPDPPSQGGGRKWGFLTPPGGGYFCTFGSQISCESGSGAPICLIWGGVSPIRGPRTPPPPAPPGGGGGGGGGRRTPNN